MLVIALDFETFWSSDYTLKKLPYLNYIRDPRFAIHGAGFKVMDEALQGEPALWLRPADLRSALSLLDPADTALIGQNLLFDGTILAERFNFVPALYFDSMAMSQFSVGHILGRVGLSTVVEALGIGQKRDSVLHRTRGRHWTDFSDLEKAEMAVYACEDTEQAVEIVRRFLPLQPDSEMWAQDWSIRAFTSRPLVLDREGMVEALEGIRAHKQTLLTKLGLKSAATLRSDKQFAELLRSCGIEPGMKQGTNGEIYAFAKTDKFMKDLLEDDDPDVQLLASARVGHRTSILETRCQRMIALAETEGQHGLAIRYHAAHTGRFGGTDHCNWQNLPKRTALRHAVRAPEGYEIFLADYGQIEVRTLAWMANEPSLLELFSDPKADVYCTFGSQYIYHRTITKADVAERDVAKAAVLALGFSQGAIGFQNYCRMRGIIIDLLTAEMVVQAYRNAYRGSIGAFWKWMRRAIEHMGWQAPGDILWGTHPQPMLRACTDTMTLGTTEHAYGAIWLPSGERAVRYYGMEHDQIADEWQWQKRPGQRSKLWHGLATENSVQAVARDIMLNGARRVQDAFGLVCAFTSHDEMMWLLPTAGRSERWKREMKAAIDFELCQPPAWVIAFNDRPVLPLAVDSKWGYTYGDVK